MVEQEGLALPILDPESAILIGLARVTASAALAALLEEKIMNPTVCTHKNNPNFWIFGLVFFLYFFDHGHLLSVSLIPAVGRHRPE